MEIIALQEYTDKYISLYEGQIRNVQDGMATELIEKGIVAQHDETSPGGSGSSGGCNANCILFVNIECEIDEQNHEIITTSCNKTFTDIVNAIEAGKIAIANIKIDNGGSLRYYNSLINYNKGEGFVFSTSSNQGYMVCIYFYANSELPDISSILFDSGGDGSSPK